MSNITVPYGSLYYLDGDYKESKYRAYQGLLTKAFLRHCSAKHCLRHGSGSGIYFHINASDLLLSLGAKAQTLHVVCPSIFSVFLNVLLCLEEINFKISYGFMARLSI